MKMPLRAAEEHRPNGYVGPAVDPLEHGHPQDEDVKML